MKVTDEMIKRAGKVSIDGGNTWVDAKDIAEWLSDDVNWALVEPACLGNDARFKPVREAFGWSIPQNRTRAEWVRETASEYFGLIIK